MSDKPSTLPAEGHYNMTLLSIEGKIGKTHKNPYTMLTFEWPNNGNIIVNILGSMDNIIAWRRCIGQTFEVRLKHKSIEDRTFLDTKIIG